MYDKNNNAHLLNLSENIPKFKNFKLSENTVRTVEFRSWKPVNKEGRKIRSTVFLWTPQIFSRNSPQYICGPHNFIVGKQIPELRL